MSAPPEWTESPEPLPGEIRLGTQGWSYPDWVGPFYPRGVLHGDLLRYYARAFDTVELDTTFYAVPRQQVVAGWRAAVPDGFLFSAKLPQTITHMKRLRGAEADLEALLQALEPLGDCLGALLIQLPPDFHPDERPALEAFLRQLPAGYQWALEVRHRSWIHPELFDFLGERGVGWTVLDMAGMPRVPEVTADFAYVRWLGDRHSLALSDLAERDRAESLDRWAATLSDLSYRVNRVYGYFSDTWGGHAPASVRAMQQRLGIHSEPDVGGIVRQPSLFPDVEV